MDSTSASSNVSSIIEDSDYDVEDSDSPDQKERKNNIIDDSSEEDGDSANSSDGGISDEIDESISVEDDAFNTSVGIAIRRSMHRLSKAYSNEHEVTNTTNEEIPDIDGSSDSDDSSPVHRHHRQVKNYIISDDDSEEETSQQPKGHTNASKESTSSTNASSIHEVSKNSINQSANSPRKVISSSDEESPTVDRSRRSMNQTVTSPEEISPIEKNPDKTYEYPVDASEISSEELESPKTKDKSLALSVSQDVSDDEVEVVSAPEKSKRVIEISSSSDEGENDDVQSLQKSFAISMAKEETLNTTINPVVAQEKAILVYKQQQIQSLLAKQMAVYKAANLNALPDKGELLRSDIKKKQNELIKLDDQIKQLKSKESLISPPQVKDVKVAPLFKQDSREMDPRYLKPTTKFNEELGKKAQETFDREQSLTVERLHALHGSLLNRPTEDQKAEDPRGLKVPLMPHQQHALAWLLWREEQKPPGGVLADDMGLGKTLTMISLVMASIAKKQADGDSDGESEWKSSMRPQKNLGGTLVVAPASLLAQWEAEVKNRCKRGLLSVELFHGNNREKVPRRLAKNDIVVTTYNILSREFKTSGVLYKIQWRRVILDEAHVVRNHKSQACEAVCGLYANKRWALTGTPIHNKEMDLYSILKFLRCSPFDDVRVWKRWVDNKNAAGHERLATVMKTLMLRRTKQELQAKGALDDLPDKSIETINVQLDPEERNAYDKVMVFSRTLFAQFLAQRAEKHHMFELGGGKYDKPAWETTYKKTQFTKAQEQLLSHHADVKSHEILVLLLRLRQICCHPPLIESMLDQEDIEGTEIDGVGDNNEALLKQMDNLNISSANNENEGDVGVDDKVKEHLLTSDNPVFDSNRRCSKMRAILDKVNEILEKRDKMIIVSQWVGVLDAIGNHLDSIKGISYCKFTGKVAVKDRQSIMDNFNSPTSKVNTMLLSLTAGGVGLNLVGANHLLLIDIHWNPQLESQAQDRIYRFGQKKDVFIYKYICSDTIEERIQALQTRKLEIASSVLSGGGTSVGSKLSLDDLKSLFSL